MTNQVSTKVSTFNRTYAHWPIVLGGHCCLLDGHVNNHTRVKVHDNVVEHLGVFLRAPVIDLLYWRLRGISVP